MLVCNWRTAALERKQLTYEHLQQRHPHLIFSHITGFGGKGPKSNYPGYEHVIAASTGRMQLFSGIVDRHGPVFSALQVGTHACAQSTAFGILAALLEREDLGGGRLVETSLLQGMLPYEMGSMIGSQFPEQFAEMFALADNNEVPMPLFLSPGSSRRRSMVSSLGILPHLFDNFCWSQDLRDILIDPDFDSQLLFLDQAKHEAFRERMLAHPRKPAAE